MLKKFLRKILKKCWVNFEEILRKFRKIGKKMLENFEEI